MKKIRPPKTRWLVLLLVSIVFLVLGVGIGIAIKKEKPALSDSKEEQVKKLQNRIRELETKPNQNQTDKAEIARLKKELDQLKNLLPPPPSPPQNGRYSALIPTKKEREYEKGENGIPLPISSVGLGTDRIDYFEYTPGHLVAGSALMTDSLDGAWKGITHIIHAVNQPYSAFNNNEQWFIDYVVKSVQNSIILADRYKFENLAIPSMGGGTFLGNCDPKKLAEGMIRGAINQLEKCQNLKKITFVDWKDNPTKYLEKAILEKFSKELWEKWIGKVSVIAGGGDIRDKNLHGASVIVNAANTQLKFGSEVSGAIAEQVGDKTKIEAKAQELITKFNT